MKSDISNRKDILFVITKFYDKLLADDKMIPFFEDIIAKNQLEHHLEIITDFWEDLLLQTYKYKNNPMQKHLDFQKKMNFEKKHFDLWLNHFIETINQNFKGEIAQNMQTRARSIATVIQIKMNLHS